MKKMFKIIALILLVFLSFSSKANAAQLNQITFRYDRLKTSNLTNVQVVIVPSTVASEGLIHINFSSLVSLSAGVSINTTNIPTGSVALPGSLAVSKIGQTASITGLTDLTVGTTYAFNLVGVSTPSSPGQIIDSLKSFTGGSSPIDSGSAASYFITDDQIVVTASVAPIFTFTLSGNTDVFLSQLTGSTVAATTGNTITVGTNANKGWTAWVKSAYTSLRSVGTGESIGTLGTLGDGNPSTCVNGADCYLVDADVVTTGAGTGALSIRGDYNGIGAVQGGTLSTIFQPFAGRTGKTDGDIVRLIARASVNNTRTAGDDYTDTLTVVGAGNF